MIRRASESEISARDVLLCECSRLAIGDSALSKIVRGQLDRHAVSRYDSDKMFPHLPSDMSYDLMTIFKFDLELGAWKRLDYGALQLDYFFLPGHKYNKNQL